MPLKTILIDKKAFISHGNWEAPLQELLRGLCQYGVSVFDISISDGFPHMESGYGDCLMIADCEATVQQANARNMAVIGYQPAIPGIPEDRQEREKICSHLDMIVEGFEEVDYFFLNRVYQRFHHLPWTIMETERCILREMTLDDLDTLYELYRPEKITHYIGGLHENREEEEAFTKAYIENMYRFYGYGLWVVIEKATGRLIGRAGLDHLDMEDEICLTLGYVIAQEKQNQGYATEVCRGILNYAEKELDFPSVCCLIQEENSVSIHLAEKLGFRFEKNVVHNGKKMLLYKSFHTHA